MTDTPSDILTEDGDRLGRLEVMVADLAQVLLDQEVGPHLETVRGLTSQASKARSTEERDRFRRERSEVFTAARSRRVEALRRVLDDLV